jgi:apolipoprotein N-acyltransferase
LKLILPFLGSLVSAALLFLAYPRNDYGFLAWVGLVPLLLILPGIRVMPAFFISILCGFAYFSGVLVWVYHIPGFQPVHHLLVGLYLSPFFGIFGLVYVLMARRRSLVFALSATPFVWVSLEYVRTNASFLSLPWGFLSHTQYQHPSVIQVSSLTGAYGVSFLIVAVNAALVALLSPALCGPGRLISAPSSRAGISLRVAGRGGLAAFSLLALSVIYGRMVLSAAPVEDGLKVSVLQGNIGGEMKKNPRDFALPIMNTYFDLTEEAARHNPDLIVWPEASTPGLILKQPGMLALTTKTIKRAGAHFVIGSSEYPKFSKEATQLNRKGNTALHFSPLGEVLGQYLKIHLVPFGEEIPFERSIPWPEFIVSNKDANWDLPGSEHTLFDIGDYRFGVVICWEQVFPDLFRTFVRDGAHFMLNITNEGWFGDSAAPYQMLAISVFRAAENRVPLVRAANTGISGFIDRFGRIEGLVNRSGKETFVSGQLTQQVRPATAKTFYTLYGDIFALSSLVVSAAMILFTLPRKRRRGSAGPPPT